MDLNLFNNLPLNGAELKSVQKELAFEFGVQDFTIRAVEDNGTAKVIHVMHQGQIYNDPSYLVNWQVWTDHVFNTIKPVIDAGEQPILPAAPLMQPAEPVRPLISDKREANDEPVKKTKKKKPEPEPKSKLPLIIIIVVLVLAVAGAGVWWFVIRDAEETPTPEPEYGLQQPDLPPIEDIPIIDDAWASDVSEYDSALDLARSFIGIVPQSQANIIEQLMWSGFSDEVIEWTLNQIEFEVDWYQQAAWAAQSFMETWNHTEEELHAHIIASGFDESQADYALSTIEFE